MGVDILTALDQVRRENKKSESSPPDILSALAQVRSEKGTIAGYNVIGEDSDHPIHYGTHKGGGVWDIGGNYAKSINKSLDDIADDLQNRGYVVAVRRKGQPKIESDHIHFADPDVNPREAARLRKQASGRRKTAKSKPKSATYPADSWMGAIQAGDAGEAIDKAVAGYTKRTTTPEPKPKKQSWTQPLAEEAAAERESFAATRLPVTRQQAEAQLRQREGVNTEMSELMDRQLIGAEIAASLFAPSAVAKVAPKLARMGLAARIGAGAGIGAAENLAYNAVAELPELANNPSAYLEMQKAGLLPNVLLGAAGGALGGALIRQGKPAVPVRRPGPMTRAEADIRAARAMEAAGGAKPRRVADVDTLEGDGFPVSTLEEMAAIDRRLSAGEAQAVDDAQLAGYLARTRGDSAGTGGVVGRAPGAQGRPTQSITDPAQGVVAVGKKLSINRNNLPAAKAFLDQLEVRIMDTEAKIPGATPSKAKRLQQNVNAARRDYNKLKTEHDALVVPSPTPKPAPRAKVASETTPEPVAGAKGRTDSGRYYESLRDESGRPVGQEVDPEFIKNVDTLEDAQSGRPISLTGYRWWSNEQAPGTGTFYAVSEDTAVGYAYQRRMGEGRGAPHSTVQTEPITLRNPLVVDGGHAEAANQLLRNMKPDNPLSGDAAIKAQGDYRAWDKWLASAAREQGYDGIVFRHWRDTDVALPDGSPLTVVGSNTEVMSFAKNTLEPVAPKPPVEKPKPTTNAQIAKAAKKKVEGSHEDIYTTRLEVGKTYTNRNETPTKIISINHKNGTAVIEQRGKQAHYNVTYLEDSLSENPVTEAVAPVGVTWQKATERTSELDKKADAAFMKAADTIEAARVQQRKIKIPESGPTDAISAEYKKLQAIIDKNMAIREAARSYAQKPYAEPTPVPPTPAAKQAAKGGKKPKLVELNAGPNVASAIRRADDLDLPPPPREPSGSFTVDKPEGMPRKYDVRDELFLQPLGIYDPTGPIIQKGAYDRLGTIRLPDGTEKALGTQAGRAIRQTERKITAGIFEADKKIDQIEAYLKATVKTRPLRPLANKAAYRHVVSDFVDLIEKPVDDAQRVAAKNGDTPLGKALRLHDEMTEEFRQYIIKQRRGLGLPMPDDWGITEKGYYRHLFLGDIRVLADGKLMGTARTYAEAQKLAMDILKETPNATVTARARNMFFGDPTVRVSTKKFFKMLGLLGDRVDVNMAELMEDVRGVIGQKRSRQKFQGYALKRMGAEGYSKLYGDVMRIHAAQVYRTQEISHLNRQLQPVIEELKRAGLEGLGEAMERHLDAIWGVPTKDEKLFGAMIENTPVLRNYVGNPTFALRSLGQSLTRLQTVGKLTLKPSSALVNYLQRYSTMWPFMSTTDFIKTEAQLRKPATRRWLRERGVFSGTTKLESGAPVMKRSLSAWNPTHWFGKASEDNRGMGYIYGYNLGKKRGYTEAQSHDLGMSWAEKVEFDNSVYNSVPILRSPTARVFGQFKGFQLKNLENIREVFVPEGVGRAERVGRIAKWSTAQLGLGGVRSLGIGGSLIGGYKVANYLSTQLQSYGMKKDDADYLAKAVYYGAPSLFGQDLSASLGVFELPYGFTDEAKIVNFFFGPTGGTALALKKQADRVDWAEVLKGNAGSAFNDVDTTKLIKSLSPNASRLLETVRQRVEKDKVVTEVKVGKNRYVTLTPYESVMYALGFMPVKVSEVFDRPKAKKSTSGYGQWKPKNYSTPKYGRAN